MAAFIENPHLDRQDKYLEFGATNTMSAATTYPCGYSASATDGTFLDLGKGDLEGMSIIFHVDAAVTGTGTVTATFKVAVSDDKSTWTEVAASPAIGSANLTADKEFAVAIPRGSAKGKYMKATVTTAGTTITAGKVSAYVDAYIGK